MILQANIKLKINPGFGWIYFGISYKNTSINPDKYWFIAECSSGVGTYNELGGSSVLSDASGRLKFVTTANNLNNNSYLIESFTINTHNIVGTIMIAVYTPHLLPELITGTARLVYNT